MKELMMFLFTVLSLQLIAQDILGDWNGTLSYQGIELRMVLHISGENGKYQSTMDSPDQGATGIPLDKTTYENGKLTIEAEALGMKYTADLDEHGAMLTGTFNQQGVSIPLVLTKEGEKSGSINQSGIGEANEVLGDWYGVLDISGTQLTIVFHIMDSDGSLTSTMDSPDQNANGISIDETSYENGNLKIVAKALNVEYTATLNEDGDALNGTFNQNGMSWDLKMTRNEVETETVIRPQEPKDFPYLREEVKFINPKGGHQLAGTLTMPKDGQFEKAVILI